MVHQSLPDPIVRGEYHNHQDDPESTVKLSVIVISFDMAREVPRTLQSLSRDYQQGVRDLEYEVLLVDNGSPEPLNPSTWEDVDVPVHLAYIEDATPTIVPAINRALQQASGEIICLMVDAAHLLTPGVFRWALAGFTLFDNPVVATRYFWLGPEAQNDSIAAGYNKQREDDNLHAINWPEDGYRLFEIGVPLRSTPGRVTWFNRMFESNCLFLRREHFLEIGGADERFDLPGGGFINTDIFKQAVDAPGVDAVQLIGEGSFHQLHGGVTTSVSRKQRAAKIESFFAQYEQIRGDRDIITTNRFNYLGHLPTEHSMIHRERFQ